LKRKAEEISARYDSGKRSYGIMERILEGGYGKARLER